MNQELGREFTSTESLAIATGQTTIMDIVHGYALELDEAWRAEVHVVMPSGLVITRGMLEDELREARAFRPVAARAARIFMVGVNASSNMFA